MDTNGVRIHAPYVAAGGAAGLVIGVCAGYIAQHRVFQARLDREVLALKEEYNARLDELEDVACRLPHLADASTSDQDHRSPAMGNYATEVAAEQSAGPGGVEPDEIDAAILQAAQERLKEAVTEFQGHEDLDLADGRSPERKAYLEQELVDRITSKAYVISEEDFLAGEKGYQQIEVTYYAGDKVLADDQGQPIPELVRTVGMLSPELFGGVSGDPHIRYVRNEKLEVDFEITLSNRAYVDEVLNYGRAGRRNDAAERPAGGEESAS
jgi:hypothetical protein